ncbi:MAG TPA: tRNA preQ1(34) S-adenosylmethionine ribosyltransferase-isomerase QueA [Stellaceae bacterium]|nr:tRNA preQ1(34) S-adenosylmethionine ribosyltransferase-isomerase QueA [Stellaceae bacterium]
MHLDDFAYDLPPERIADRPCEPREAARLLVLPAAGDFADRRISDLPELLRPGDLLVFNDTKVIPARLYGRRGMAQIEVTLYREEEPGLWRAFVKGARRLDPGDIVEFAPGFSAGVAAKYPEGDVALRFGVAGEDFRAALARHGAMPLPPYLKRPRGGDPGDRVRYQTIFAREEGAVAAPTAGLHFTQSLLDRLAERGILWTTLTLHVGPGTFLPVKERDPRAHRMHAEWGILSPEAAGHIAAARLRRGRVVAVGTTSLRLLETAAAEQGEVRPYAGETRLFILPGYRFRAIDMLLTNFHLPRSTLLMLVAALAGLPRIRAAYAHAIREGYRFYSYGDACLIERPR